MNPLSSRLIPILIISILLLSGCAAKESSVEGKFLSRRDKIDNKNMLQTYILIEQAIRQGAIEHTPDELAKAEAAFDEASELMKSRQEQQALEYLKIAEIHSNHALSIIRNKNNEQKIAELEGELNGLNTRLNTHKKELENNVAILKNLRDKNLVSDELLASSATNHYEQALESIIEAENVSAKLYAPKRFTKAEELLKQAEINLKIRKFELSIEQSKQVLQLTLSAREKSQKKLKIREQMLLDFKNIYGTYANPASGGIRIVSSQFFAPKGTSILFDAFPSLDALAEKIRKYPKYRLSIEAFVNDFEVEGNNVRTSQIQAQRIEAYLISRGIPKARFSKVIGLGSGLSIGRIVERRLIELFIDLRSRQVEVSSE